MNLAFDKKINIISFDIPYPPNYGGVIDVFYKLKALHHLGVEIYLHTFEYGRGEQKELEKYCTKVYYYPRKPFVKSFLSKKPFIVKSREHYLLEDRLLKTKIPILFEGLHSVASLDNQSLGVKTMVRTHNIEHDYYRGLASSEKKILKKAFFSTEAIKLKTFEKILHKTDYILTISPIEQNYFNKKYGSKSKYIPVFTAIDFEELRPREDFILWHGDLRVSDNVKSALWAIKVVEKTKFKLVIASNTNDDTVLKMCKKHKNITFNQLKNKCLDLEELKSKAAVNLLFTFQATGIKLKLINTLVKSRFVIVNKKMIQGTGLESLCVEANTISEIREKLTFFMSVEFQKEDRILRKEKLALFNPLKNAQKIIDLLL